MSAVNDWKQRLAKGAPAQDDAPKALDNTVKRQLAWAAGTERFSRRDPVYHVSESFTRTFDTIGARRARDAAGMNETAMRSETPGLDGLEGGERAQNGAKSSGLDGSEGIDYELKTDMSSLFEETPGEGAPFLKQFAQTSMKRGTLSYGVIKGTGRMMLVSCLKRTVGQSEPKNLRQRKLFEGASRTRNLDLGAPDQATFNPGQINSAVGLTVDVLRDASRVVGSLKELAEGTNVLKKGSGSETIERMYPFLSDAKERALLTSYKEALGRTTGAEQHAVLEGAISKTTALIEKKRQMKELFCTQLRQISSRAQEALAVFSSDAFAAELTRELLGEPVAAGTPPPDDGSGSGGRRAGAQEEIDLEDIDADSALEPEDDHDREL